jgi:hypothetical protein
MKKYLIFILTICFLAAFVNCRKEISTNFSANEETRNTAPAIESISYRDAPIQTAWGYLNRYGMTGYGIEPPFPSPPPPTLDDCCYRPSEMCRYAEMPPPFSDGEYFLPEVFDFLKENPTGSICTVSLDEKDEYIHFNILMHGETVGADIEKNRPVFFTLNSDVEVSGKSAEVLGYSKITLLKGEYPIDYGSNSLGNVLLHYKID